METAERHTPEPTVVSERPMQVMTSRDFNQRTHAAKLAAAHGPVLVTHRDQPALVLMTYGDYERLASPPRSLAEALTGAPELADIDFEIPPRVDTGREVDL